MNERDQQTADTAHVSAPAGTTKNETVPAGDPLLEKLQSVEDVVRDIRRIAEESTREQRHRDLSPYRVMAGIAQAIALILLLWSIVEFAFVESERYSVVFFRLAFAIMMQLVTIAMLLADRNREA